MTQRIFDVENEKDMALLWSILPDWAEKIKKSSQPYNYDVILSGNENYAKEACIFKINWHDKTEITRPIQEATEADIHKLCYFWDYDEEQENGTGSFGKLCIIDEHKVEGTKYQGQNIGWFPHCRRLTKQEIEELC
jgi:hypothetical protein